LVATSWRGPFFCLLLLALLAQACSAAPAAAPHDAPDAGYLLVYERTGGVANLRDRLALQADGALEIQRAGQSQQATLDQAQLDTLTQLLTATQFDALQAEYLPPRDCCDLFDYRLTYHGKSVHAKDGAVPEQLSLVLDQLNQWIDTYSSPP
jgi:hypothetical protein